MQTLFSGVETTQDATSSIELYKCVSHNIFNALVCQFKYIVISIIFQRTIKEFAGVTKKQSEFKHPVHLLKIRSQHEIWNFCFCVVLVRQFQLR